MLCGACLVNPSALPSREPGGGGEGVSVESGCPHPCVPSASLGAGTDPGNPLAGTDQAHPNMQTAVGPAPFGTWAALEDVSSLLGLRFEQVPDIVDTVLSAPVLVRETRGGRSEAALRCGFDR